MVCNHYRLEDDMKIDIKQNKGYSLLEIGIGLLIITVFTTFSLGLFNGCHNNYRVIQQRNIALSHAISKMEYILQTNDFSKLGFESDMISRNGILSAARDASPSDRMQGYYAVPVDSLDDIENNMKLRVSYRRIPTSNSNEAMDNTVLKVTVQVDYKVRVNDTEYRNLKLEAVKLTK